MNITLQDIKSELDYIVDIVLKLVEKDSDGNLHFEKIKTGYLKSHLERYDNKYDNEENDWVVERSLRLIRTARQCFISIEENNYFIPRLAAYRGWFLFLIEFDSVRYLINAKLKDPSKYLKLVYIRNELPFPVYIGYNNMYANKEIKFYVDQGCTFTIMAEFFTLGFYIQDVNNEDNMMYIDIAIPQGKNEPTYNLKVEDNHIVAKLNKYSL